MPIPVNGRWADRRHCMRVIAIVLKKKTDTEKYCTICGKIIKRKNEDSSQWNKVKKCPKCSKIVNGLKKKYCTSCGKLFRQQDECPNIKAWVSWGLCSNCKKLNLDRRKKIELFGLRLIDEFCSNIEKQNFAPEQKGELPDNLEKCVLPIFRAIKDFSKKLYKAEKGLKEEYEDYEKVCKKYRSHDEIFEKYEKNISALVHNQLLEFVDYEYIS